MRSAEKSRPSRRRPAGPTPRILALSGVLITASLLLLRSREDSLAPEPAPAPARLASPSPFASSAGGVAPPREGRVEDTDTRRLRRLLDDTTTLMRRMAELSSDDIAQFQELSELTNEFGVSLDSGTAALLVKNMPPGFTATSLGDICLRRWAKDERAEAAEWMAKNPEASPVAASALMQGWFAEDAGAARAYVGALPSGVWRDNVATSAAEDALMAGRPEETLGFLDLSGAANPRREEVREWAALQWGKNSHAEASAWATRAATPQERERLLAAVNVGHANKDPLAAADALLSSVKTGDVAGPALGSIVRIWAAKEPVAAAGWAQAFPDGQERKIAVEQLLDVWARVDEASARGWISRLPDEDSRHAAEDVLRKMKAEYALDAGETPE